MHAMRTMPHVLIADENWYRRWRLGCRLCRLPVVIEVAWSAEQALTQMAAAPPAVVMINLDGTRLDGEDLQHRMQADPRLATVPAIATTRKRNIPTAEGFSYHLAAPIGEIELLSALTDL